MLRFSPHVARRVQETRWHRSERTEPQPDGSLVWRAQIAEPKEMLPWIRGWGADVEVLGPEGLRGTLEAEVRKMARVYGVSEMKLQDALIAHRRERDGKEQSLVDHLKGTAELAKRFAGKIGLPELGEVMGLAHDFGKASKEFQDYLKSATGLKNPDEDDYIDYESRKGKIDHSTAGAQLVYEKCSHLGKEGEFLAQFLALAIASHHSGLIDCLTPTGEDNFSRRITKDDSVTHVSEARGKLPEIEDGLNKTLTLDILKQFMQKLQSLREQNDSKETIAFKLGILARFLLSCLLDADRLNTADFEFPENSVIRSYGNYVSWDMLIERLEKTFNEFAQAVAQTKEGSQAREVYQLRSQVARACREAATKPKGIYQLTVPTGGGKTLASLRFALHHAKHHGMDRVFYVAPYITIIDQNADTLRTILEPESERGRVVLEHHSNFVPEEDTHRRHSLLAENWDAPIVCTTQVQFLEALFGAGTRDTRRMHQLAKAVIILDEVQTVPIRIVHMLNVALRFLAHSCGSTVVLCTATQPPLDRLPDNPYRSLIVKQEQRIILNEVELFKSMQRVEVHYARKDGGMTNDEIVDLAGRALDSEGSVLIVVNTRAMARTLYEQIKVRRLAPTYHLSTNMCPAHRMDVLNTIKEKLAAKEPVICVSTQLIEAGVDIDFGAVIRSLAGLDSVAQSAGRCNRHGLRATPGKVWIVNPQEEDIDQLLDIKIGRDQAQRVLSEFKSGNDFIGLEAITTYYRYYYSSRKDEMDYLVRSSSAVGRDDTLFRLLSTNELSVASYRSSRGVNPPLLLNQSFQSAAREFCVIDSPTIGVIVPYGDEGKTIINALCSASELDNRVKFLRQAQRFSVCLFRRQFEELNRVGAILETNSGIHYLDERYYSKEFGWSHDPVNDMDTLIV
ncbi:CRISPR-associated helicase, Cas3 family [Roseiflexus sp. RS-1]|nr:CRISPR-associated helicase, Cas3 family [Roseiflexus sp. RS-1]